MAITVDTQDINNYPGTVKRVTLDLDSIVPTGFEGDEQYLVKATTTAYSDSSNTAIQDLYVLEFDVGWCKSSGFAGTGGKFVLDSAHNSMGIKLDNTISGTNETGFYTITLENDGLAKTGEDIAADIETKIRAIECGAGDTGYQLAYKNASVEYNGGKFKIISGTMGRYYTGQYKTSIQVTSSGISNSCVDTLGFNMPVTSEDIAGVAIAETLILSNYTHDTSPLYIGLGTGVQAGDSLMIKDGTNSDYFTAITVSGTAVQVATQAVNAYTGILIDYAVADGAMVQVIKEQDPDNKPNSYFESVDSLLRFATKVVINQIYYGS